VGPFEKEDASAKHARSGAVWSVPQWTPLETAPRPLLSSLSTPSLNSPREVGATAPAASIPHRRRFRRTLTTSAVFDRRQPLWPPPSSTGATSGPHIGRRGWSTVRWFRVGKARSAGVAIRASHRGAALLVQELLRKGRNNRPGLSVRGCGSSRTSAFDTRGRS
jgi:hypothetical protein